MKKIFLFIVITLSYMVGFSQNSIEGKITDSQNQPLMGATVYIPELNTGTASDTDGYYKINHLPNGKITLQFSYVGFANEVKTLELFNESKTLNIVLTETVIETEEIVITSGYNATQHDNAVKIDVIKLQAHHVSNNPNFTAVLAKTPGVDMISKGNGVSKPVIRGLSMNDILVLNNSVRFENYQYSSHHPTGIDEFGIEKIEIIKGPASLMYGSDAIGGVINFIKEKPTKTGKIEGDFNSQYFSNSLGYVNNLGIKGAGDHVYGGIRIGQKSHADYLQGGGTFVPNSRFSERSLKSHLGFKSKMGSFNLYYDFNRQNLGLVEDEAVENITERGRKVNLLYQGFNTHFFSTQNKLLFHKTKLDVNAAYQNTTLAHFDPEGGYELEMALNTLTYEAKFTLPSNEKSDYIIGFQGFNQKNNNLNSRETVLLPNATTDNYSLFGLFQWDFWEKLKIQTGLRYDKKFIQTESVGQVSDADFRQALDKNYNSFSGSLGGTYHISNTWLLRLNTASAFRTPNLAELTANGPHETIYEKGDDTLVPEKSFEADISFHYHKPNGTFDLAAFYNSITDYIFIAPTGSESPSGLPVYQYNQANSYLYGTEIGWHFHPKNLDFLHIESTFSSVIGKKSDGEFLPFIPAHKLNFDVRLEGKDGTFLTEPFVAVHSHSAFKQNNIAPDESKTDTYTLFDITAGGSFKVNQQKFIFNFGIHNLLDTKYIDHLSTLKEVNYFNPGRNFTVSLKIPFEAN